MEKPEDKKPILQGFHEDSFREFLQSKLTILAVLLRLFVYLYIDVESLLKWWPL